MGPLMETVNTLQQEAIKNIKKLIIDGVLLQGARVNEVEVSNRLNMSRGPIRESLRILNQEGLVTYVPRKGMFVTTLEKKDIEEIYDIRFYLEKNAVELGFHNISNETIERLEVILDKMESASQKQQKNELVQLDYEFHEVIISLPKYKRLSHNWNSYTAQIELIFAEIFRLGTEKVEDIPHAHRLVLDTLKAGDKRAFIEELEKHYLAGKEKLIAAWESKKILRR